MLKKKALLIALICFGIKIFGQQPITASFIATLGTDTVIVETYNMLPNHLYGKAFVRYPIGQVGVFDFHFYPDGSIKHYSMSYMNPDSSYKSLCHLGHGAFLLAIYIKQSDQI